MKKSVRLSRVMAEYMLRTDLEQAGIINSHDIHMCIILSSKNPDINEIVCFTFNRNQSLEPLIEYMKNRFGLETYVRQGYFEVRFDVSLDRLAEICAVIKLTRNVV